MHRSGTSIRLTQSLCLMPYSHGWEQWKRYYYANISYEYVAWISWPKNIDLVGFLHIYCIWHLVANDSYPHILIDGSIILSHYPWPKWPSVHTLSAVCVFTRCMRWKKAKIHRKAHDKIGRKKSSTHMIDHIIQQPHWPMSVRRVSKADEKKEEKAIYKADEIPPIYNSNIQWQGR